MRGRSLPSNRVLDDCSGGNVRGGGGNALIAVVADRLGPVGVVVDRLGPAVAALAARDPFGPRRANGPNGDRSIDESIDRSPLGLGIPRWPREAAKFEAPSAESSAAPYPSAAL
eukprot:5573803-Pyramimonas_sp.AAC.1